MSPWRWRPMAGALASAAFRLIVRVTAFSKTGLLSWAAALAAKPPSKPHGRGNAKAPPAPTSTPAHLQSWVERHQPQPLAAFRGLPSVQARQVHLPLEVCLISAGAMATEGPRLLQPEDMQPLMASAGS